MSGSVPSDLTANPITFDECEPLIVIGILMIIFAIAMAVAFRDMSVRHAQELAVVAVTLL